MHKYPRFNDHLYLIILSFIADRRIFCREILFYENLFIAPQIPLNFFPLYLNFFSSSQYRKTSKEDC